MKAEQCVLTVFMVVTIVAAGAASCGPGSSDAPILAPSRAVRALELCAEKIGRRATKSIGGTKRKFEVPVCQSSSLPGDSSVEKIVPIPVGYSLSASEKNQLVVHVKIGVDFSGASPDLSKAQNPVEIAARINQECGTRIKRLWRESGVGAELGLLITTAEKAVTDTDHVLALERSVGDLQRVRIAHWPNRATFFLGEEPALAVCEESKPGESAKCRQRARQAVKEENSQFCANLAVMVGHYLGLAREDAVVGRCGEKITTLASTSTSTFMSAAQVYRGEEFWSKARITYLDRATIMSTGCSEQAAYFRESTAPFASDRAPRETLLRVARVR